MPTLLDLRTDLRGRLDESLAAFWLDPVLNRYLNEAVREVCSETQCLEEIRTLQTVAGLESYPAPEDALMIHRVDYVVSPSYVITLKRVSFQDLYSQWGTYRFQGTWPQLWTSWGAQVATNRKLIYLWPIPSQQATFHMFYYRLPHPMNVDTDVAELPLGMDQCAVVYAEYLAKRQDHDPMWQDCLTDYKERLEKIYQRTRKFTDQQQNVFSSPESSGPFAILEG